MCIKGLRLTVRALTNYCCFNKGPDTLDNQSLSLWFHDPTDETIMDKKKIVRITTVPSSLKILLKNQLRFINNYFEIVAVSSLHQDLEDVAKEQGVRICVVEMSRKITPTKDLLSLIKMYRLLIREKPHFVHPHTPKAGSIGMLPARPAAARHRLHTVPG